MASSCHSAPFHITVLISGFGSNLQALIDASRTPALPTVHFVRVISDRKDAYGLTRARDAEIPTHHLGILPYKKRFPDSSPDPTFADARRAYDADLAALVLEPKPDLVVCAGFMRILTPSFLTPLREAGVPAINLHPSLYGDLVGAHCIERAWEEFRTGKRTTTGSMVHYVIDEVDRGEMIVQEEIDMVGCETLDDLKERLGKVEKRIIVKATQIIIDKSSKSTAI